MSENPSSRKYTGKKDKTEVEVYMEAFKALEEYNKVLQKTS